MEQTFISTSEARKTLSDLINQVKYQGKSFSIGRHGKAEAVLMPPKTAGTVKAPDIHEAVQKTRAEKNKTEDLSSPVYKRKFETLAKKYGLSLMVLFGSHAKGRPKWHSDVDIAFISEKNFNPAQENKLYGDLYSLLGREDIDLVDLNKTHDVLLRYEIFTHGRILYAINSDIFRKNRERAYFDYHDFQKYFDQKEKLIEKKLNILLSEQ